MNYERRDLSSWDSVRFTIVQSTIVHPGKTRLIRATILNPLCDTCIPFKVQSFRFENSVILREEFWWKAVCEILYGVSEEIDLMLDGVS